MSWPSGVQANGGPQGLKAISAAYPSLTFYPTGGVTEKNLQETLLLGELQSCAWGFFAKVEELLLFVHFFGRSQFAAQSRDAWKHCASCHFGIYLPIATLLKLESKRKRSWQSEDYLALKQAVGVAISPCK